MAHSLLTRIFSLPKSISLPMTGIDISDRSIKFLTLRGRGEHLRLDKSGEYTLSSGVMQGGRIADKDKLTEVLALLSKEQDINSAAISLPEERAFVVNMPTPKVKPNEVRGSIELQLENYIPMAPTDVIFDIEYSGSGDESVVTAFPKEDVELYSSVLEGAGITPVSFEIETQSLARSLIPINEPGSILIVDFGRTRTGVAVAEDGIVRFTSTVSMGGDAIVSALVERFKVTPDIARQMKERDGLHRTLYAEQFMAITPVIALVKDEIIKFRAYWESRHSEHRSKHSISRVILCGGDSNIPGLIEYLSAGLDISCELGNPWVNIYDLNDEVPPMILGSSLRYAVSIGLAMRNSQKFLENEH